MNWDTLHVHLNSPTGRVPPAAGWRRSREHSERLADQELWLVWAGRGWMRTRTARLDLRPGFCVWMRPGGIYDAGQDDAAPLGITYIHFEVTHSRGQKVPTDKLTDGREIWDLADLNYFDAATRRIVTLFERAERGDGKQRVPAELLLKALLVDMTSEARHAQTATQPHWQKTIQAAAAMIRENAGQLPPIRLLAERANMSAAHFSRAFRRVMGVSPQHYAVEARVHMARQLLLETDMAAGKIAEMLGYKDVYFFSRQFKQHAGVPPSVFRNLRHQGPP